MDVSASAKDRDRIQRIALDTEGVRAVHAVRGRSVGGGTQVDLHILVDPGMTVRRGHAISEDVKRRLLASGPAVLDVVVHLEPYESEYPQRREQSRERQ